VGRVVSGQWLGSLCTSHAPHPALCATSPADFMCKVPAGEGARSADEGRCVCFVRPGAGSRRIDVRCHRAARGLSWSKWTWSKAAPVEVEIVVDVVVLVSVAKDDRLRVDSGQCLGFEPLGQLGPAGPYVVDEGREVCPPLEELGRGVETKRPTQPRSDNSSSASTAFATRTRAS